MGTTEGESYWRARKGVRKGDGDEFGHADGEGIFERIDEGTKQWGGGGEGMDGCKHKWS